MGHRFPKIVLCLGLPGSASTWVYNIVRYLLGQTRRSVAAFYLDDNFADLRAVLEASEEQVDYVVLKSHKADSHSLNSSRRTPPAVFCRCATRAIAWCL